MNTPDPVDPNELRPSPIRHYSLSPELLEQIAFIYEHVGPYLDTTLEQFEINFMRDAERALAGLRRWPSFDSGDGSRGHAPDLWESELKPEFAPGGVKVAETKGLLGSVEAAQEGRRLELVVRLDLRPLGHAQISVEDGTGDGNEFFCEFKLDVHGQALTPSNDQGNPTAARNR